MKPPEPRRGKPVRAVGLLSGGLDSTLAAGLLKSQGVEVTGIHFSTGFCKVDHRRAVRRRKDKNERRLRNEALHAGAQGRYPVEIVDVSREYLQVVLSPKHGYGSQANPCVDCRIFMLRKAREHADRIGAEVVFTGEVIGQRPMSQNREAMRVVEAQSGLKGRLLRPLSARHLEPTAAESEGRIDRSRLGALNGRSRRGQERLAGSLGVIEYPQPSGGCCYLADPAYARRFRDLVAHIGADAVTREEIVILKVGRQFRLSISAKIHVGREESENVFLGRFAAGRWVAEAAGIEGPTALIMGSPDDADLRLAASIVARYADTEDRAEVDVRLSRGAARAPGPTGSGEGEGEGEEQDGFDGAIPPGLPEFVEQITLRAVPADPAGLERLRV